MLLTSRLLLKLLPFVMTCLASTATAQSLAPARAQAPHLTVSMLHVDEAYQPAGGQGAETQASPRSGSTHDLTGYPPRPSARAWVSRGLIAGGLGMAAGGAAGAWAWGRRGMCYYDADDPYVRTARISGAVVAGVGLVTALAGSILLLVSSREQRQLGAWRKRAVGM